MPQRPGRVLAVASRGGHWIQLMRLRPAFDGADVAFLSTGPGEARDVPGHRFHNAVDANRSTKFKLVIQLAQVAWVVLRERPGVVVSTGATVGFFACRLGKLLGARVVWVDSIANAEELSASGRRAGGFADLWLTQWPDLARPEGPQHEGAVL